MAGRKQQREIEEARKSGALPPELDEDGKPINPHVPSFMANAPWYSKVRRVLGGRVASGSTCVAVMSLQADGPSMKHQKSTRKRHEAGYAEKRDPYKNWDPAMHDVTLQRYQREEAAREAEKAKEMAAKQRRKAERRAERAARRKAAEAKGEVLSSSSSESSDAASSGDSDSDGEGGEDAKESEGHQAVQTGVQRYGTKNKMTVRNLRIREDTAKYLLNLNEDSAFYDAKTRSMRADPLPHVPASQKMYAGDNAARLSGDTAGMLEAQVFAWEAHGKGHAVSLQTNPTQVALMQEAHKTRASEAAQRRAAALEAKYGGTSHASAPLPEEMLLGQGEGYAPMVAAAAAAGGGVNAQGVPISKWAEDEVPGNHTHVWGSWFDVHTREWGFKCCYQTTRGVYCTGEAGRLAWEDAQLRRRRQEEAAAASGPSQSLAEQRAEAIAAGEASEEHTHTTLPPSAAAAEAEAAASGGGGRGSLEVQEHDEEGALAVSSGRRGRVHVSGLSEGDRKRRYNGSRVMGGAGKASDSGADASGGRSGGSGAAPPRSTFDDPMPELQDSAEPAAKVPRKG